MPPAVLMAISGGGDNGAFTAGLLNGWTRTGARPEFKLVTSISTGALIAPFAFLGPEYDATLEEVYTTISPQDVIKPRSFINGVFSDAMADNAPLWKLTRKTVNTELLKEIAAEYAKGRFLLMDGGTMAQVFVYPPAISTEAIGEATGTSRERTLYVIRNARLDPDWAQVNRRTVSIAGRAVASLIHTQGIGDLYRIYATAERDGVDFNLGSIPPTFNAAHPEEFDNAYMRALYDEGYTMALQGFPWQKTPPGYEGVSATTPDSP